MTAQHPIPKIDAFFILLSDGLVIPQYNKFLPLNIGNKLIAKRNNKIWQNRYNLQTMVLKGFYIFWQCPFNSLPVILENSQYKQNECANSSNSNRGKKSQNLYLLHKSKWHLTASYQKDEEYFTIIKLIFYPSFIIRNIAINYLLECSFKNGQFNYTNPQVIYQNS